MARHIYTGCLLGFAAFFLQACFDSGLEGGDAQNSGSAVSLQTAGWAAIKFPSLCPGGFGPKGMPLKVPCNPDNMWKQAPGSALDITVGPDQSIYKVDVEDAYGSHSLSRFVNGGWQPIVGACDKIVAGRNGELWGIAINSEIWHRVGETWTHESHGKDIAFGANGDVYRVSTDPSWDTYAIDKWGGSSQGWTRISGAAKKISVAPDGTLWAIARMDEIWSYAPSTGAWTKRPGKAREITVDGSRRVYILTMEEDVSGYKIAKWNGSGWAPASGGAVKIAGSYPTGLWVVSSDKSIWLHGAP